MFERMIQWMRQTLLRIFGQGDNGLAVSPTMEGLIGQWAKLYEGSHGKGACSLGLPAFIAGEFARLVVLESQITLTGARGAWMNGQLDAFRRSLRPNVEYA